jgi:methylated-DNA-protein-cysteine methyltransferase-like protein
MTSFSEEVYQLTKTIPKGKVMTYGQIAKELGKPRAARAVGNALHHNPNPKTIPCHRVVNKEGRLAPGFSSRGRRASGLCGWREHKKRLVAEGVKFKDEKHVDLKKHKF